MGLVKILALVSGFGVCLVCQAEDTPPKSEKKSPPVIAHIKIMGDLSEGATESGLFSSAVPDTLRSIQDRIEKAAKDPAVVALYLEVEDVSIGWGKLDEMESALQKFRKSGKKIFAWTASEESKDYLVAAMADEVAVPESVSLMILGVQSSVTFYKELFDLIGVRADMLKVGDFKSAVEPYTRSNLSGPARKQLESMIDDFYTQSLVGRIARFRKSKGLDDAKVIKAIDEAPLVAALAKELGFVDKLDYYENYTSTLGKACGKTEATLSKNYGKPKSKDDEMDFSNPFALLKALSPTKTKESKNPKIAIIHAIGEIVSGKSSFGFTGGETVGSTTLIEAIQKAESDPTVKAIILRIDSPGGSALASDLIHAELMRCKKPIIASMSDVAASGGYYIASGAKRIMAEPSTITGSIGVFGGKVALGGAYEKVGIRTDVVKRGANAGINSMERVFNDSERKAMTRVIEAIYEQFLDRALKGRERAGKKMTKEELTKLAGGRVWTGRQALENGLVDQLGTLEDAIVWAVKEANLPKDQRPELLDLPKGKNLFDSLLDIKLQVSAESALLEKLNLMGLSSEAKALGQLLLLRKEKVWLLPLHHLDVK